jgi:hypothetical protein
LTVEFSTVFLLFVGAVGHQISQLAPDFLSCIQLAKVAVLLRVFKLLKLVVLLSDEVGTILRGEGVVITR